MLFWSLEVDYSRVFSTTAGICKLSMLLVHKPPIEAPLFSKLAIYSGSLLLSLGLFMLSLAQPDQFYQVFLSQGVCAGIGAGMLYVPSYAVVGHYFLKRRTLAMSIVASGSSLGAAIHPIMLNNLFDSIGFGNAVRASAGLVSGMLLCACFLMRTRLPPPDKTIPLIPAIRKFSKDWAYICAVAGYVTFCYKLANKV